MACAMLLLILRRMAVVGALDVGMLRLLPREWSFHSRAVAG